MRLLIVEDEPDIAEGLQTGLRRAGYQTDWCADGREGFEAAAVQPYALILLDWMLPGMDGPTICRNLRDMDIQTPILMVTARDQVPDRVRGLDVGADDYLVKPFSLDELLARVRALLRRESARRASVHHVGPLTVDSVARTATLSGAPVRLTQREFELAEALAKNPGRVLTRDQILQGVWNSDEALPNTVNFHMKELRKKIDPDGRLIHTVHGMGYVMRWEGD